MTLQQYVESISRLFPDKGQTEIITDVNSALREFIDRTKILRGTIVVTSDPTAIGGIDAVLNSIPLAAGTAITVTQLETFETLASSGYVALEMPETVCAIKGISAVSAAGIDFSPRVAYDVYDREIRIYNKYSNANTLPTDVVTVELEVLVYDNVLVELSDIPKIPVEFHRALEAAVMEKYYRRSPISSGNDFAINVAIAKSMKDEWDVSVARAKQMYYINQSVGAGTTGLSDY